MLEPTLTPVTQPERPIITQVDVWPIDIPMTHPFVVATGTRVVAENVFVSVSLSNGVSGIGEAAPFPEVGGEDRMTCLTALKYLAPILLGQPITDIPTIARAIAERAPKQPAARCALETALFDAHCRATGIPMWQLWGGTDVRPRETDITIPIGTVEETLTLARHWYSHGFRLFKMKVGNDVGSDIRRLEAIHRLFHDVVFIGDGNQGFTRQECLTFVRGVQRFGGQLFLLEQPVPRDDLESLAAIRRDTHIPVAADESVRSISDAQQVVAHEAADYINIKIMKTGIVEAIEIASFTLRSNLKLMIGGMLESRIAMSCSFSLVLGMKGFEVLDLDTPLLLAEDPVSGGYEYQGPQLHPWTTAGLGLTPTEATSQHIVMKL